MWKWIGIVVGLTVLAAVVVVTVVVEVEAYYRLESLA